MLDSLSSLEICVILFGLALGFALVYFLPSSGRKGEKRGASQSEADGDGSSKERAGSDGSDREMSGRWYVVLGVNPDAKEEEVKFAYRALLQKYHPDKLASFGEEFRLIAERRMKEINAAYDSFKSINQ